MMLSNFAKSWILLLLCPCLAARDFQGTIIPDPSNQNLDLPTSSNYFAVCMLFRNQDRYISEWISYHRCIGVNHFYLYNDGSIDNFACILRPYIKAGFVTLFHTNLKNADGPQVVVYDHCLQLMKAKKTRWTAFIDPDEFLYLGNNSVDQAFRDFETFSAVQLSWVHFVSKHKHIQEESDLVIEAYTMRESLAHKHIVARKSIIFAQNTTTMHVHQPELVVGAYCTDESHIALEKCEHIGMLSAQKLYLHHYSTKSYNYFRCKALTPHAKRSGSLYRYGGKTRKEALKKIQTIYKMKVNKFARHSQEDLALLEKKYCVVNHMEKYKEKGCTRTTCWCNDCKNTLF